MPFLINKPAPFSTNNKGSSTNSVGESNVTPN